MNFIVKLLIALRIISEPNADNALKSLNKALAKLETAVNHQVAKAKKLAEASAAAALAAAEAQVQADRAQRSAGKIAELVS